MLKKYGDLNPIKIVNPELDDENTKKSLKKAINKVKEESLEKNSEDVKSEK